MSAIIHIPIQRQLNRCVESIKEARISGKPIQFLCTKDIKIVDDLLSDSRLAPVQGRLVETDKSNKPLRQPNVIYTLNFKEPATFKGWDINAFGPTEPSVYVLRLYSVEETNANYQTLLQQLSNFIEVYSGIVRSHSLNKETGQAHLLYPELAHSTILVVTPFAPKLPPNIAMYSKIIRVKPVSDDEFRELIIRLMEAYDGVALSQEEVTCIDTPIDDYLKEMERQLRGVEQTKIEQIFAIIKNRLGRVYFQDQWKSYRDEVCRIIREEKLAFIETSDVLKLVDCDKALKPAGLENLWQWLDRRKEKIIHYNEQKRLRGASMPKGILMSGVPGSGKSMTAKYIANLLQLPLLKLDFGDLLDKYLGNSEHRMQSALDTAIEMSPCVLWIDEIEKAFSGANSDNEAPSKRMISKFLTWMQEKENEEACCFVFATANSIIGMPPELFRSGRFDAKFYTFLPSLEDCVEIFKQTIVSQNKLYRQTHEELELFSEEELVADFRQLLNNVDGPILRDGKFFTGSDITALIEETKDEYEYVSKHPIAAKRKYIYETSTFIKTMKEILGSFKTYGETNLRDCAECFSQICYNNFRPAAEPVLKTDKKHYNESRETVFVMIDEEFKYEYDKQMYRAISEIIQKIFHPQKEMK